MTAVTTRQQDAGLTDLAVGGITAFSTIDWPGKLSCVCFLAGCPWRCAYCQNHILWDASAAHSSWTELEELLKHRKGLLDGVVFSGGEPLMQTALPAAIKRVRELGYAVGLHTGGAIPERLEEVLPYLSWVGFDVKAPWELYEKITHVVGSGAYAQKSLCLLLRSKIELEVRTTWHPALLSSADIVRIGWSLRMLGVKHWVIQAYRHQGTIGMLPEVSVISADVPEEAKTCVEHFEFRQA